jgi:hypothetical protein
MTAWAEQQSTRLDHTNTFIVASSNNNNNNNNDMIGTVGECGQQTAGKPWLCLANKHGGTTARVCQLRLHRFQRSIGKDNKRHRFQRSIGKDNKQEQTANRKSPFVSWRSTAGMEHCLVASTFRI